MVNDVGRPPVRILDRDRILYAAYELLTTEDLADVSLSRIARDLGVRAPSLYRYVDGWDDLLNGIRALVIAQIDTAHFSTAPLREALECWVRSYVRAFATLHPSACARIAVLPMQSLPAPMRMYETICVAMTRDGWDDERILPALVAMESFAIGSALDLRAPDRYTEPDDAESYPEYFRLSTLSGAKRRDMSVDVGVSAFLEVLFRDTTAARSDARDPTRTR